MNNLTQKEKTLLQDQKTHEEVCIKKYNDYANQAQDPQLKQVFSANAKSEQQHLDTINQIMNGQVPNMNQNQQQQGQSNTQAQGTQSTQSMSTGSGSKNDADLCNDMLMTEKYVSGAYDNAIYEFRDTNIRQALNHIQKEEQQHGESVFKYMESKGLYNPQ
ncbi:MAG TPA: spore coat protein [Clostridia bacterium]|nr:spore coat protein [Clostridia bacterium]